MPAPTRPGQRCWRVFTSVCCPRPSCPGHRAAPGFSQCSPQLLPVQPVVPGTGAATQGISASHLPVARPRRWQSYTVSVTALGTAQPGEMGASYPSPLCPCVVGPFIACLLKGAVWVAALAWHTCVLRTCPCSELVGCCGVGKRGLPFLGTKTRGKQSSLCPALMVEASQGIRLYVITYGVMPRPWVSWAWGG